MFDFFKDVVREISGIDSESARKQRREKEEREKLNRFIFSQKNKTMIIVLGVLYLVMAIATVSAAKNLSNPIATIITYSVLGMLDVATLISLIFCGKKGEIAALICIFLFVCGMVLSIMLM